MLSFLSLRLSLVLVCTVLFQHQSPNATPGLPQVAASPSARPRGLLLVSGYNSDALHVYDVATGQHKQNIAPVPGAQSIVMGPDSLLYVCAENADEVLRIDPLTLALLGPFVFDDPLTSEDESGGLNGPTGAVFGPDGHLYVASFNTDEVLRYDGTTGSFLDVFVGAGSGGLNGPDAGLVFGPDQDLYVPSFYSNRILRYDGSSGQSLGTFISNSPGSLFRPRDVVFHGDSVYVASAGNARINRYDLNGTYVEKFAQAPAPYCINFHPDTAQLYVASGDSVRRHAAPDGAFLGTPVPAGAGGVDAATFLFFLRP